jgi:DNA polymerase-3 subunit epsilon
MLCEKLLGLEKTATSCFAYRLDRCNGACVDKEEAIRYNLRFITAFANFKIKPWPFSGPIMITEQNLLSKTYDYFLLDKWCYLGKISGDGNGASDRILENEQVFDMDVYKILLRYLRSHQNRKKIKLLRQDDLGKLDASVLQQG